MALWKKSESHRQGQSTLRPHQISHPGVASHPDPPSGVSHVGMAPQLEMCQQPRLSRPQGLHYGCGGRLLQYSYSARLGLACAHHYGFGGRRRASSVCLSSASSALRPTGVTVAPPSHHRDSLLREVSPSPQDGIPRVSLRLRAPAEQSCSFPPSTTCHMLLWVCASVPSPTALRVYLGMVQFAHEFSEVKERETVFWDCSFAPPVFFFSGVFLRLRSRYGQIELHLNLFKAQQRNRWLRRR